jgi:hypothetical protein
MRQIECRKALWILANHLNLVEVVEVVEVVEILEVATRREPMLL